MPFGSIFANDLLKLILQALPIAGLADNAAAGPLAQLYIALHTADPGAAGDQTTSEVSYVGYARMPLARSALGWTVAGNQASPVAPVEFNEMTGGAGGLVTHVTVGTALAGAGKVLLRGAVTPSVLVEAGKIPRLKSTTSITFQV